MQTQTSDFFVHEKALCETAQVGRGSKVWAFVHILPGAVIGQDCNICDHVFIENDVVVGDRVTVKCGVQLWDGVRVEDDVFIGPNVSFANDKFPRSKRQQARDEHTILEYGCSVGAGATILPGVRIGQRSMVGAGAVVTHNVPPFAIVAGNPARIIDYSRTDNQIRSKVTVESYPESGEFRSIVQGVYLKKQRMFEDLRGKLTVMDIDTDLPFVPRRMFIVYGTEGRKVRGEHAHKQCEQFLICTAGSVNVLVDDGSNRQEYILDDPTSGLYIPPRVWATQYRFTKGSSTLVFASQPYDPEDYIRDYKQFLDLIKK